MHIVPFSAVTTITNASRGAGNAAVSVNVAYKEDTDRAGQILKDIVAEMRKESEYRQAIRGDLELWGVDKVDGSMASIVGQIRCTDSGRWPVQREFNRRMKRRFQECGIEIASAAPDHPDAGPGAGRYRRGSDAAARERADRIALVCAISAGLAPLYNLNVFKVSCCRARLARRGLNEASMLKDGEYTAWYRTSQGQGTGRVFLSEGRISGQDCLHHLWRNLRR